MIQEADDGTWLTKAELAHVRGISVASATKLIRRQGWRRQPGNDGRVRVLVPGDWMQPRYDDPRDDEAADPRDQTAGPMDNGGALAAFETALAAIETAHASEVATLREQLTLATARADRLDLLVETERRRIAAIEAKAAAAEGALTQAQTYAAELQAERDAARAEAQATALAVEELRQADTDRRARGRWARLRAAWRGNG